MMMDKNSQLALVIAYYLSKFDQRAYKELKYETMTAAHLELGSILNVKASKIKNMRDEFDPIHDNPRVGSYQRDLRPSRMEIVDKYENFSEEELKDVVFKIISDGYSTMLKL